MLLGTDAVLAKLRFEAPFPLIVGWSSIWKNVRDEQMIKHIKDDL